jgi:hypothetical protein
MCVMGFVMPDPVEEAKKLAAVINARREEMLVFPIDRLLTDNPRLDRRVISEGVGRFHKERVAKVPPQAKYPDAKVWVEYQLAFQKALRELAGLNDSEMGVVLSLNLYLCFRGYRMCRPPAARDEKCRVAYLPESDRGQIHIKNVDDPITHWKPHRERPSCLPQGSGLVSDGVGSGLHLDDEPEELFPLPVYQMLGASGIDNVPAAVEFYTRYSTFWGGANLLLHDDKKRSATIEKCSYNHITVYYPGADGKSHVSGMTCRDIKSVQGAYQQAKRMEYIKLYNRGDDCVDLVFWAKCREFEAKLAGALSAMPKVAKFADVVSLFTSEYPKGLNKPGLRLHPEEGLVGYTLLIHCTLADEKKYLTWNRSEDGKVFDAEPAVFQY